MYRESDRFTVNDDRMAEDAATNYIYYKTFKLADAINSLDFMVDAL